MTEIKDSIPFHSYRFADDYDVYVDYGKGDPVKMNNDEETFLDVEKFLTELKSPSIYAIKSTQKDHSVQSNNSDANHFTSSKAKQFIRIREYNPDNINSKTSLKFHPNQDSVLTKSSIIPNEHWLLNNKYNPHSNPYIKRMHDEFSEKSTAISCSSSRRTTQTKPLCLNIFVNGASKSMRGLVPKANLSLTDGDFGDDAGLVVENRDFYFVGLADGASGNRSLGIDPSEFSRNLLSSCRKYFLENNSQLPKIIISAMQHVQAKQIRGSSTLCSFILAKNEHILTSLNIGDSGFIIYRDKKIYHRSTCTTSSDGCEPKQLFAIENAYGLPYPIDEKEIFSDCSEDRIKVQKDDLIILSSDGLWDVLKAEELHQIIEQNLNRNFQNLADDLLNYALSGYMVNSRDDILIIICQVNAS